MSDKEEPDIRHVCAAFESQTWRKSLCKNCFHSLNEHSEELLTQEAAAVAKEKAAAASQTSSKSTFLKQDSSKGKTTPAIEPKNVKGIKTEKEKSPKEVKGKNGAIKDVSKDNGKLSKVKDLALENGKSSKTATPTTSKSSTKIKSPTTTSSCTSSPTNSPIKSPLKPPTLSSTSTTTTTSSAITVATNPVPPEASEMSSSSNAPKTTVSKTKNFASKFESKASVLPKDKLSKTPDPRSGTLSAADKLSKTPDPRSSTLSAADKLSKTPDPRSSTLSAADKLSKTPDPRSGTLSAADKLSKTPDPRSDTLSAATNNGKCADDSFDSNPSFKPLSKKLPDNKSSPPKLDPKTPRKITEEPKLSDVTSKGSKPEPAKVNGNKSISQTGDKSTSEDGSDKISSLLESKPECKDSKPPSVSRPKMSIFSRDILKSAKDAVKQTRSSPEAGDDKQKSPPSKDERTNKGNESLKVSSIKSSTTIAATEKDRAGTTLKSSVGKVSENKIKQQESESVSKTSAISSKLKDADKSQEANINDSKMAAILNKTRPLGKVTGKSSDLKTMDNSDSRDTSKSFTGRTKKESSPVSDSPKADSDRFSSRDREKEKKEKSVNEKKIDIVPPSLISNKQATSPGTSLSPSKTTAPPTTTQPAEIKSSPAVAETTNLKTLKLDVGREAKSVPSSLEKFKSLEKTKTKTSDRQTLLSPTLTPSSSISQAPKKRDEHNDKSKEGATKKLPADVKEAVKLKENLREKEEKLLTLSKKLANMEEQVKTLEEEREKLKGVSLNNQKKDTEKMLNDLRTQLSRMESQCSRLERDNKSLIDKLHQQEATVKRDQETRGKNSANMNLEEDLEAAEKELEEVKVSNKEFQIQIMEMKNEMDEMYDHFRESEHEEFRELQKELDITAKNCRMLQFKLRKAERCNDQIEEDRMRYEEKLRMLQDQFDSKDAKNHIRVLEEELRVAKEVSVRLHDELDIVEDKRNKALEDNRHLTDLLEHTDRRQFRLEMEIDKLRDIVAELKQQLKEAKAANNNNTNNNNNNNKESSPDRRVHSTIYTRSISID